LIGLVTLCVFFFVEGLNRTGQRDAAQALARSLRVLILPMYLAWTLFAIVRVATLGPLAQPGLFGAVVSGIGLAVGLLPYVFADYLLNLCRRDAPRNSQRR
jgi:hypothetical protein